MFREQDGPSPCGFPLFTIQLAPIKKILISRCDISHGNGHKSLAHVKLASVLCVWVIKFLCDYAPFHFGLFLGSAIKARRPVWENSSLFWFLSFLLALLSPHISLSPAGIIKYPVRRSLSNATWRDRDTLSVSSATLECVWIFKQAEKKLKAVI